MEKEEAMRRINALLPLQIAVLVMAGCSLEQEEKLSRALPSNSSESGERGEAKARLGPERQRDGTLAERAEPTALDAVDRLVEEPLPAVIDDGIHHARVGREAWQMGEYEEAAEKLGIAAASGKVEPYDVYLLGLSLWKTGRLEQSESALAEAAWKMESFPRATVNLARVRIERGDLDGARSAIETALEIDPEFPPAHNVLGRILLARGDLDGAAEAFERAASLDPDDAWPLNNLGYGLLVGGRADEAVAPLEQAVARDGGLAVAWHNLALARELLGDLPGALVAARRASGLRGERSAYGQTAERLAALTGESVTGVAEDRLQPESEVGDSDQEGSLASLSVEAPAGSVSNP
jgi:Flp pilus assembly protein TadD